MAGALGRLGVLLEVSLRVSPAPRRETSRSFELDWTGASKTVGALMRRPFPLSGAFHDGARLHLRLAGGEAAVEAARTELGGENRGPAGLCGGPCATMRLGSLAAPRLWRLSVLAHRAVLPIRWRVRWFTTGLALSDG